MEDIRIEIEEEREIRKGGEMLGHHRKFRRGDGGRGESFSPPEGEVPVFARSSGDSEDYFEQFCKQKDIACERVPTGKEKTNDFLFWPSGQEVAVEVKWRERGGITENNGIYSSNPGHWVDRKIQESVSGKRSQLKESWEQGTPTMLVLLGSDIIYRVYPEDIEWGMHGCPVVVLELPLMRNIGTKNAHEHRMNSPAPDRRRLSAVACLLSYRKEYREDAGTEVYHRLYIKHNPYADHPLKKEWVEDIDYSITDSLWRIKDGERC